MDSSASPYKRKRRSGFGADGLNREKLQPGLLSGPLRILSGLYGSVVALDPDKTPFCKRRPGNQRRYGAGHNGLSSSVSGLLERACSHGSSGRTAPSARFQPVPGDYGSAVKASV